MTESALVSIIIPARNEELYIGRTLEALFVAARNLETAGGRAETIVVDNASTDATADRAGEFPVTVVREETRRIASVRNAGARAARGEFLVFLDADSRPSPNALVRIAETLSSGRYAGGGVKIRPEKWNLGVLVVYGGLPLVTRILGVSAGMLFSTREAFDAVGGFDERLYAAEDLELAIALKRHARICGKKFANLSDVYITTSIRKLHKSTIREHLIFPWYLVNKQAVRRRENCRLWYNDGYR
jgi:glycosyltransferase involved in cell wall biosynthesis